VSVRRLVGLLAVLALAPIAAGCGVDTGDGGAARDLLQRASETPPRSADVKFELEASLDGVKELGGPVRLTLAGPVRSNGQGTLPDLDWRVHGEAAGKELDARLVTVPDNAFIEYRGTTYEVGEQLMGSITSRLPRGQTDPKELRGLGLDASAWIEDAEVSDAEVGGVPTRRISGEVDVRKLLEGLDRLFRSPAVGGQLPPGASPPRIPESAIDQIEDAVKEAHLETDVGRDDGIMRRNAFDVRFEVPEDLRDRAKGLRGGKLKLLLELTDVNGSQRVTPPSGARPIDELLQSLGIPPGLLLGPGFTSPAPG
jgi:hypothetical protein